MELYTHVPVMKRVVDVLRQKVRALFHSARTLTIATASAPVMNRHPPLAALQPADTRVAYLRTAAEINHLHLIKILQGFNVVGVYCVDSLFITDASKLIAGNLTALSAMVGSVVVVDRNLRISSVHAARRTFYSHPLISMTYDLNV